MRVVAFDAHQIIVALGMPGDILETVAFGLANPRLMGWVRTIRFGLPLDFSRIPAVLSVLPSLITTRRYSALEGILDFARILGKSISSL
jgi:hypothetical protein